MIVLYRFLKVLEDSEMVEDVPVSELEPGDVIAQEDIDIERVRQENLVGKILEKLNSLVGRGRLGSYISELQARYGYSQIVGVKKDEIEKLEDDRDVAEVEVKAGVRFIPAFPIALAVTDIMGGGIYLLTVLVS
jgi:hypothetical protein